MALGFFRRRQKVVLIIMVLLMVAFLLPSSIRGCFQRDPRKFVVGTVGDTKITAGMRQAAEAEMRLLRESSLALGTFPPRRFGEDEFFIFLQANRNRTLPWVLLVHEAEQMGVRVSKTQVDDFLAASNLTGEAYRQELANLRERGYTERRFRQAIAHYLMIVEAFRAARMTAPPSLGELRRAFRDLRERIQLDMVLFPASDFAKDAPDPPESTVRDWFKKHKHLAPNAPTNKTKYGFGYLQPDRVKVSYLFIDRDLVRRAVEPPEELMIRYWRRHKGELKKTVTSTKPVSTTQGTRPTEPGVAEVPYERYSEAKPRIREILKDRAAEAKVSELLALARERIAQAGAGEDAYEKAVAGMIHPADAILARPVGPMPFQSARIRTAIEQLGALAKVKIVYPIGRQDKRFLDPDLVVETKWKRLTLKQALARIGKTAGYPRLKWVTCEGLGEAIFPVEPVNLVPVTAGTTGMISLADLRDDALLGSATVDAAGRGHTLAAVARTAKEFQGPRPRITPLIEVGADFRQPMFVSGVRRGRLLWRLLAAEPVHEPKELTAEIRAQVVKDLKLVRGFEAALKAAEDMRARIGPEADALKKLAEAQGREFFQTEPFPRLTIVQGRTEIPRVPGVGRDREFIRAAFELVPENPDGPHGDRPTKVVALYRQRKVVLIQRIGYEPALAQEFENLGVLMLAPLLTGQRVQQEALTWFRGDNIVRRVGYKPKYPTP